MFDRKSTLVWIWMPFAVAVVAACGGKSDDDTTGGTSGTGGNVASGGSPGSSGAPSSGGAPTSGGRGSGGASQSGDPAVCFPMLSEYATALHTAKQCDPTLSVEQCALKVGSALVCGCPTFVNGRNDTAIAELSSISKAYEANHCKSLLACGACLETTRAFCSEAGRCEDMVGMSCKVNGVVYPDGATLKDPFSCNHCSCVNGWLSGCTEAFCEVPCPEGTAPGSSCAECGPTDACLVREFGCFPTCSDTCPEGGVCSRGICVNLCG